MQKTWWANLDGRVRDSHRAEHGETVPTICRSKSVAIYCASPGMTASARGQKICVIADASFIFDCRSGCIEKKAVCIVANGPSLGRKRPMKGSGSKVATACVFLARHRPSRLVFVCQ